MKFTILILNMPCELPNKGLGRNFRVRRKKKKISLDLSLMPTRFLKDFFPYISCLRLWLLR